MRPTPAALPILLALPLLIAPVARADDGAMPTARVPFWRPVDLPDDVLVLADGWSLSEGTRMIPDRFPYLVGARNADADTRTGIPVRPATLARMLVRAPQEPGGEPCVFRDSDQAIAAVRLFVPGVVVSTAAQRDRVLRALEAPADRPKPEVGPPSVSPMDAGDSLFPVYGWRVRLFAAEIDRRLAFVHVEATVLAEGTITIERTVLADGPYTTWQSMQSEDPEHLFRERARRERVDRAYERLLDALEPARTVEELWGAVRVLQRRSRLLRLLDDARVDGAIAILPLAGGTTLRAEFRERRGIAWTWRIDERAGAGDDARVVRRILDHTHP